MFSSERDWCSLTRTLLDILAKRSLVSEEISQETLEMLTEVHLLNRAVKRKSSRMVHLLVQFVVVLPDNSKLYPFVPNLPGPGGLTPLHLAASIENAEAIVDALTDDPQQVCSVKFNLCLLIGFLAYILFLTFHNDRRLV